MSIRLILPLTMDNRGPDGHAEITSAPPLNVKNGSVRTGAHAGVAALKGETFQIDVLIAGPKGLPYK